MQKLISDFKGSGSMKQFCEESNAIFSAINNAKVIMPPSYVGAEPTITIEDAGGSGKVLRLDLGDALVFSLANISWSFSGNAFTAPNNVTISYKNAAVVNGQLKLYITVTKV